MKEIFYIEDTPANKISYYLALAFVMTLPFNRMYSELSLIGLLLHTLIHLRKEDLHWSYRWTGWLTAILYLVTIFSTLYAPHPSKAFPEWEKQLALILFPLVIWFSRLDWQHYRMRLLKGFAFSCLLTALYLYGANLYIISSLHRPFTELFTKPYMNHAFSAPIDLHATYYAAYLALSVVVFSNLLVRRWNKGLVRLGYSVAILLCLATILQLASRSVCISMAVIINLFLPFSLVSGRMRWRVFAVTLSITLLAVTMVVHNNEMHSRYLLQLKQDLKSDTGAIEDPEPRMARWQCAWELIKASPWIGYGAGTEVEKLRERYQAHNLVISYTYSLNAHNQFLSFWLKTGVFGMLVYITVLVLGFREAWRRRDIYLLAFLFIIVCISLSENILDVNKGIFFFSSFFVFFAPKPVLAHIFTHGNKNPGPAVGTRTSRYYDFLP